MILPLPHPDLEAELAEALLERQAMNLPQLTQRVDAESSQVKLLLDILVRERKVECLRPVALSGQRPPRTRSNERVFYRWCRATDHACIWQQTV